ARDKPWAGPANDADRQALCLAARPFDLAAECGERSRHDVWRIEARLRILLGWRGVIDEAVRQHQRAHLQALVEQARASEVLQHLGSEATDRTFLDGDQHLVLARQPADQVGAEWLAKPAATNGVARAFRAMT